MITTIKDLVETIVKHYKLGCDGIFIEDVQIPYDTVMEIIQGFDSITTTFMMFNGSNRTEKYNVTYEYKESEDSIDNFYIFLDFDCNDEDNW